MNCPGCDTAIPAGGQFCPMCGAKVGTAPAVQVVAPPVAEPITRPSEVHHYHHAQPQQPVLIEQTGKKWKKMYLWSCLFGFFGFTSCVAAAGGEPSASPFAGIFLLIAAGLYIRARFGAWWNHG